MTAPPGTPFRIAVATTLLGIVLATPLLAAAPRLDGRRALATRRTARPLPHLHLVPGQPVRFPRELLPELIREFEAEIEEPGVESPKEPRDLAGIENSSRPSSGSNRLINDPSGDPPASTQSENTIAAHGRYLVAGWNESADTGVPRSFSGYGYSSDGGKTWTDGGTLPRAGSTDFGVGDPSLTVDEDGNFYYANLYSPDGVVLGVSVSRGRFHGKSFKFGPPVLAGFPSEDSDLDKEWIAADPENGVLYVTYTRFRLSGESQIELVRSKDHGRTWSKPEVLTDPLAESVQGSRPAVGPDHEVYVVYLSIDLSDFTGHMRIRKSTHGGQRFGAAVNVGEGRNDHGGIFPNVVTGPPGFNRAGGVEFPSIAVDRSKGHNRGDVYVAWPEAVDFYSDFLGGAGVTAETADNDSARTATPFDLGVTLTGSFSSSTDADWYSFKGRAGQTVQFFMAPAPASESEGFLRMFCRNGDPGDGLALSYLGGGLSVVVFTLPSDGIYYFRARPINPRAGFGDYYVFTGVHERGPQDVARDARDVVVSHSSNGRRWSRRAIVNHDPPRYDNAFPEVAVDGEGDVHLLWYDHRNDRKCGILTDVYHSQSRDGGDDFDSDQRVNDGPSTNWNLIPSRLAPNMGDYIALTTDGGNVYANWADGRLGTPDSWMAAIGGEHRHLAQGNDEVGAALATATTGRIALSVVNPVRLGTPVTMSLDLPIAADARLDVYSVTGQRVRSLIDGKLTAGVHRVTWNARGRDGAAVAPGVYFVALTSGETRLTRRVVLLQE